MQNFPQRHKVHKALPIVILWELDLSFSKDLSRYSGKLTTQGDKISSLNEIDLRFLIYDC